MLIKSNIGLFLEINYKNDKTKESARQALKRIEYLEEIDINKINKIFEEIPHSVLSNSSKITQLAYITKFIKYMGKAEGKFYNTDMLLKYDNDTLPKDTWDAKEIEIIKNELKLFNNREFTLIFNLLLYNACRLSEFCMVDWSIMRRQHNYNYSIIAKKGGHGRVIVVPNELTSEFEQIGVNYQYNTIQNLFVKFHKQVVDNNPTWTKSITAHCLRRQKITNMFLCGMRLEEIQVVTGHAQISTISNHYVKTSKAQMMQFMKLANLSPSDTIEITKLKSFITTQNKQIVMLETENASLTEANNKLTKENEYLNELILELKTRLDEKEIEITYLQATKAKHKEFITTTKPERFWELKGFVTKYLPNGTKEVNEH